MCDCKGKGIVMFIVALAIGAGLGFYGSKLVNKPAVDNSVDAAVAATAENSSGKTVVAKVNGDNIYKEDVEAGLKQLSIKTEDKAKAYSILLNQMVTDKLIEQKVAKAGIETTDTYKAKLLDLKKQLVKAIFFDKVIGDKIKEDDVKKEFEVVKAENAGKKEAHARHILVKTEEEANQVIKDLEKGKDFAALAKERSSDATASNGGDVGFFAEGETIPEFSKAAFALKAGEFTKTPVKSAIGFHVIKLEEIRDRKVPSYDEMKGSIRNGMAQKLVLGMVRDLRTDAKIEMFGEDGKPLPAAPEAGQVPPTGVAPAPAPAAGQPAAPAPAVAPALAPEPAKK